MLPSPLPGFQSHLPLLLWPGGQPPQMESPMVLQSMGLEAHVLPSVVLQMDRSVSD